MSSDLLRMRDQLEDIRDATPDEWAAATRLLTQHAPDLLDMLGMTA